MKELQITEAAALGVGLGASAIVTWKGVEWLRNHVTLEMVGNAWLAYVRAHDINAFDDCVISGLCSSGPLTDASINQLPHWLTAEEEQRLVSRISLGAAITRRVAEQYWKRDVAAFARRLAEPRRADVQAKPPLRFLPAANASALTTLIANPNIKNTKKKRRRSPESPVARALEAPPRKVFGRIVGSRNRRTSRWLALYDELRTNGLSVEKAITRVVAKEADNPKRDMKNIRRSVERAVERYRP